MRRYSPYRISAVVLALGWAPLALVSIPQIGRQDFPFSGTVWLGFAYAVIGPLFLTNILWFTAVDRVGAAAGVDLQQHAAVLRRALRAPDPLRVASTRSRSSAAR